MSHRQPLVAANWKMNGTLSSIRPLIREIIDGMQQGIMAEIAICPPFVYLDELARLLKGTGIALGAQNLSQHAAGAHTGEVSAGMLKDYNCRFVIVGHSERRTHHGETDQLVAEKFTQAVSSGLAPILCIGEYLEEREADDTEIVVARQLDAIINRAGIAAFAGVVVAYEPVWAIGTGKNATPEQAQEVHAFIRLSLARHDDKVADTIRILYGGSVNAANAAELFRMADVDGGLIGGASLDANEFLTICRAAT